ncbi:MAG: hypothetical protein RLY21_769 [Planctomycetota bacterium]
MKQQATITYDDALFAVAERGSDRLRVLLVRKGARPTAIESREFALNDATSLAQWLDLKRCNDLRMMLPASAVIVRSTSLPAASQTQMLTALALQAESFFLGSVPQHRLGLAVLNEGSGAERRGLIVAWPTNQPATETPQRLESITTYLPEPAALMVLASSDLPAIVADRRSGSIAIALRSPTGVVLRSAREDAMGDAWNEGLRRAIAETALNAGVEPSQIAAVVASAESAAEVDDDRVLVLDPDVRGALNGKIAVDVGSEALESSWWRTYAPLLGAAVAAAGPLAELCRLRKHEKGSEPTRLARFVERYSDPVRALKVVVASVAIMAIAPMAFAWLRAKVYEWKMPSSLGEFQMQQFDVEQRISHYEALGRKALPATKILGDLAVATPDGIELESIQLSLSQGISVRGVAKPQNGKSPDEIVNTMATLMDSSGVFQKTSWNWTTPDGRNVFKFNLSAQIARPTLIAEVPESRDWAVKTLAKRKYPDPNESKSETGGDGSTTSSTNTTSSGGGSPAPTEQAGEGAQASAGTNPPATAVASAGTPPKDSTAAAANASANANAAAEGEASGATLPERGIGRRPTPDPNETPKAPVSGGAGTGAGGGPGSVAKANLVVPDTFTDEQLKAMTTAELREKLTVFAQARRREDLDPETAARVRTDFQRIVDALREAQTK